MNIQGRYKMIQYWVGIRGLRELCVVIYLMIIAKNPLWIQFL